MAQNVGKIKIKNINELMDDKSKSPTKKPTQDASTQTPVKLKKMRVISAATTTKKMKIQQDTNATVDPTMLAAVNVTHTIKSERKKDKKQLLPGQKRIHEFYKSAAKDYQVKQLQPLRSCKSELANTKTTNTTKRCQKNSNKLKAKTIKTRKRLFSDNSDTQETKSVDGCFEQKPQKNNSSKCKTAKRRTPTRRITNESIVDLCSSSEEGNTEEILAEIEKELVEPQEAVIKKELMQASEAIGKCENAAILPTPNDPCIADEQTHTDNVSTSMSSNNFIPKGRTKKPKPIPNYKIVEGTSFAVDAFQFGVIPNVTHYFLTHYHADHYVGLSGKFSQTLYASPITARLVRTFIPLDTQYLHEIELNKPLVLLEIEITAIDANHCPGAVMFLFKLKTGRCILHTGDFRASANMESEPAFWNNDVSLVYLDTTYLTVKYDFCDQHDSIGMAIDLVDKFREKHAGSRILYICGTYVIGKEKIWTALAHEFDLQVWTETQRYKALRAIGDPGIEALLCEQANANMHVISMMKIGYLSLLDYFRDFEMHFDLLLAIRPSGWEKKCNAQYRGRINIIGVPYSEHSSYKELERFVKFLKPAEVVSTVPVGRDLCVTATIPRQWYKYEGYGSMGRSFQTSITSFLHKARPSPRKLKRQKETPRSKMLISPLLTAKKKILENSNTNDQINSAHSSAGDFEDTIKTATWQSKSSPSDAQKSENKSILPVTTASDVKFNVCIDITSDVTDDWLT